MRFEGTVGDGPFSPKSAVFVWRTKADDMQLVFADVPDLCSTMTAGAWPRSGRVLSITLKLNEAPDGPFSAGDYPVRTGKDRAPRDTKRATFLELDDDCQPRLQAKAQSGLVRLAGEPLDQNATARGELDLTFAEGTLTGSFEAAYCPPPAMAPRGCK